MPRQRVDQNTQHESSKAIRRLFLRIALIVIAVSIIYYRLDQPATPVPGISWWSKKLDTQSLIIGLDPGFIMVDRNRREFSLSTWQGETICSGVANDTITLLAAAEDLYLLGSPKTLSVYQWPDTHLRDLSIEQYGTPNAAAISLSGRVAVHATNDLASYLCLFSSVGTLDWVREYDEAEITAVSISPSGNVTAAFAHPGSKTVYTIVSIDNKGDEMWIQTTSTPAYLIAHSPRDSFTVAVTLEEVVVMDSKGIRWSVDTATNLPWGATINDSGEVVLLTTEDDTAVTVLYRNGKAGWTTTIGGTPAAIKLIGEDYVAITSTTSVQLGQRGVPRWVADIPGVRSDAPQTIAGGVAAEGGYVHIAPGTLWVYYHSDSLGE